MNKFLMSFIFVVASSANVAYAVDCCAPIYPLSLGGCLQKTNVSMCGGRGEVEGYCTENGCEEAKTTEKTDELKNAVYYGYISGNNKSGNGRTVSARAKLDVCFNSGYQDVDSFTNLVSCYTGCDSTTLNTSCTGSTGAATCYERCESVF